MSASRSIRRNLQHARHANVCSRRGVWRRAFARPSAHAVEEDLLPSDWDHERITYQLISSGAMAEVWASVRPSPNPEDVVKLALGPKKVASLNLDLSFSSWEAVLAEIITSDALGADRIDYLLRDSWSRPRPSCSPATSCSPRSTTTPPGSYTTIILKDFLRAWLPDGRFPVEIDGHLSYSDNEVWAGEAMSWLRKERTRIVDEAVRALDQDEGPDEEGES